MFHDGAAALEVRDLAAGDYAVRRTDAPSDDEACTFTVAQYRLAPEFEQLQVQ